jgi:hypothetical protein
LNIFLSTYIILKVILESTNNMPASIATREGLLLQEERRDRERMFDPLMENVFESFFDFSKDEELNLFDDGNFVQADPLLQSHPVSPLERKRKSLDWNAKPQKPSYKRTKSDLTTNFRGDIMSSFPEPLPFTSEHRAPHSPLSNASYDDDLEMLSDLFLDDLKQIKPASREILKARKSEDWDAKPNFETKKRAKWSNDELRQLWEGISRHGNNWTDITEEVTSRSYCQIKDKGRRCLFLLGWSTGRSKSETDESNLHAKRIADDVLEQRYRIR